MKQQANLYRKKLPFNQLSGWIDPSIAFQDQINEKDKSKLFIFTEYLKRKFYLDCTTIRSQTGYMYQDDKNSQYMRLKFKDKVELVDYLLKIGLGYNNLKIAREIIIDEYLHDYNGKMTIYDAIKYCYIGGFKKIKSILQQIVNRISIVNIYDHSIQSDYFYNNPYNFYIYERILYALSQTFRPDYQPPTTFSDMGLMIINLRESFSVQDHQIPLQIFEAILKAYSLYLRDLYSFSDLTKYIFSGSNKYNVPIFFELPTLRYKGIYNPYLDFNFSPSTKEFSIKIANHNNINIENILEQIRINMTLELYHAKSNYGFRFDENDIKYLSSYLGVPNKHQNRDNVTDRLIGLYLWDRFYLLQNDYKLSINNIISRFINEYKEIENVKIKTVRQYGRILKQTRSCIERGLYLPLS